MAACVDILYPHATDHSGGGSCTLSTDSDCAYRDDTRIPNTRCAARAGVRGREGRILCAVRNDHALADARTLKDWLGEQLEKSQMLDTQLQRQQEHLDEVVVAAFECHMAPVPNEMFGLQQRVDELEHALHHAASGSAASSGLVHAV